MKHTLKEAVRVRQQAVVGAAGVAAEPSGCAPETGSVRGLELLVYKALGY